MTTTNPLVSFIKQHALDNYEAGGWDVIVECWSDKEIAEYLDDAGIQTTWGAVATFQTIVDVWADRQADARNSAF